MASTSSRMLALLSLLQSQRFWSGRQLQERLEVSPRTLRRDIERLRDLGYSVESIRGSTGGYRLASGETLPPLLMDSDDATVISIGLRLVSASAIEGARETSERTLGKLFPLLPERVRQRVKSLAAVTATLPRPVPRVNAETLTTLAAACRAAEYVRFEYEAHGGDVSSRYVEPYRIVTFEPRWYLLAWDMGRDAWRTFRVDRITHPSVSGARFRPRSLPAEDVAAWVSQKLIARQARYKVEVLVEAPAHLVAAQVGEWGTVEALGPEESRLIMQVDDLIWPIMILADLRADFQVVEPSELVKGMHAVGQRLISARLSRSGT